MKPATNKVVNTPNKKVITSYFKGQTPASSVIPKKPWDANVFKYIHSKSITSLGTLCDDGCTAINDKKWVRVVKGTHLVLSVNINQMDRLKNIPLTVLVPSLTTIQSFELANAIICKGKSKK